MIGGGSRAFYREPRSAHIGATIPANGVPRTVI
jgi:hypothetical protein